MRAIFLFSSFAIFFCACSRPVSQFLAQESIVASEKVIFTNTSENPDSCNWFVDGQKVSTEENLQYRFSSSGRHNVELQVFQGKHSNSIEKEIIAIPPESCRVIMKTSMGDMLFELSELTPGHQQNFIQLVEDKYYETIVFHRVINGFMIQAGDNATRTDGKTIGHKSKIPSEFNDQLIHVKGALAAARMPDNINPEKNSSGTQFYIVHGRKLSLDQVNDYEAGRLTDFSNIQRDSYLEKGGTPQLDGEYTVFGQLLDGEEVLDQIASTKTGLNDKPVEDIRIIEIILIK